ncbi:MAG: NTP transferase domain-containing protein, partial [Clostridia bacterium]|nr:NTP transferase domain-containing protein [Clostridia bacterium]
MNNVCCVILAAGEGKRMKSNEPKVLSSVLFEPMVGWVLNSVVTCGINDICVVTGYKHEKVREYLDTLEHNVESVIQTERKGTAHAVMTATEFLKKHAVGDVLILGGDAPFIDKATITKAY